MAKNCEKHYKCVDQSDFHPLDAKTLGIMAGIITLAGIFIPTWGIVGGALLIAAVWDLCRFLEGGKLVCLEKNVCVIGKVMELIPVGADKSGLEKMDDDFTFNILLSPHAEEETRNEIIMSDPFQGKFIDEQAPTTNLGLNFTQEKNYENLFHCEIKGCRVHDVCVALKVMAVVGAGVTTFCAIASAAGPFGWLACAIALLIWAAVTAAVVGITWAATHTGSMDDVLDPASGTVSVGDIVLVKGDWVHDAGHDPEGVGWNEIHPVRFVQKLSIPEQFQSDAKADEALVNQFKEEILDVHCFLAKQADDEDVKTEQERPENDWHIHPSIDGCREEIVIE